MDPSPRLACRVSRMNCFRFGLLRAAAADVRCFEREVPAIGEHPDDLHDHAPAANEPHCRRSRQVLKCHGHRWHQSQQRRECQHRNSQYSQEDFWVNRLSPLKIGELCSPGKVEFQQSLPGPFIEQNREPRRPAPDRFAVARPAAIAAIPQHWCRRRSAGIACFHPNYSFPL